MWEKGIQLNEGGKGKSRTVRFTQESYSNEAHHLTVVLFLAGW